MGTFTMKFLGTISLSMTFGLSTIASAAIQALWVFPSASQPNPVMNAGARATLLATSSASGVTMLYVSVYSSSPSNAGRYMFEDAAIAALISDAHTKGIAVYADWPSLGCGSNSFPQARMQEIVDYNGANPTASFDGVILDIEPTEPQTDSQYVTLLDQYQCIRNALPAGLQLSVAIRFFWDKSLEYPAGSGMIKPVYAHVIDMNLRNVVVMGYRDTAGPASCTSDGLVCLDQDEIKYAASANKFDIILAGLETSDPTTTGISNKETFFEEGQEVMNREAQAMLDHFGVLSGLGGFAIHNYGNSYLSGASAFWPLSNSAFPTLAHEVRVTSVTRLPNGHVRLQGVGVANRSYRIKVSTDPTPNSLLTEEFAVASPTGAIDHDCLSAVGYSKQFYRFSYP